MAGEVTSRAAAEAYVGGVCFKLGPPRLIGAELEWLTVRDDDHCSSPAPDALATALGRHAPKSLNSASPAAPLSHGSRVTVEPGGQIELSSHPFESSAEVCAALRKDAHQLGKLLATQSIRFIPAAADAARPAARILRLPRYATMESCFCRIGPYGRLMMCNTAATQVSVDAGADMAEVRARWQALNAIGPALLAAFACSPSMYGAPPGAWASQRMRAWLQLDPQRTAVAGGIDGYARWALDVPLLCVVGAPGTDWAAPEGATFADWISGALDDAVGRRPTFDDLDYHLTTLFPPVRAAGHLEVRYIDAQTHWDVPILAVEALMSSPEVVAEAATIAAATADRWLDAAQFGLDDIELRSAAEELLKLAAAHTAAPRPLALASARCRRGRAPIQEAA